MSRSLWGYNIGNKAKEYRSLADTGRWPTMTPRCDCKHWMKG